jgi:SAM-dependent methyltransferase
MKKSIGYEKSARFYDMFDTKKNIDFFKSYASQKQDVLDIGAGTGRIAIPIADDGISICCVEPSLEMINVFLGKLEKKKQLLRKIEIFNSNASSFRFSKKFDFIFMSGVFDHLISDKERLDVLENVRNHLKETGVFVFDVFIGLMKDTPLKAAGVFEDEDVSYKRYIGSQLKDNDIIQVLLRYETYVEKKLVEMIEETSLVCKISKDHLTDLLRDSKFQINNIYADYDKRPYSEGDDILIIEAQIER